MTTAFRSDQSTAERVRAELAPVRRLAIVRALALGDLLVATPALRALRAGYPQAEITLIGLPWAAGLAARLDRWIDRFVVFPGWPGIAEAPYDPARTRRFLVEQRAYGYDLVIQMHGNGGASNPFALALGGRHTAGYTPDYAPGYSLGYALDGARAGLSRAAPYPDDQPEVMRDLALAELVGCPPQGTRLEFPIMGADVAEADRLLAPLAGERGPLIGLHAGARAASRRWSPRSFAKVADELTRRHGARIILTGGPDERAIVAQVERAMRAPALNLAGQTSLGGLAALLARLDLLITSDSGPGHLAEAVGAPTVRIFGPADVRRWGPLPSERHVVVRVDVACSPCGYQDCPIDHRCLRRVTPALALEAAERLLMKGASA
ncbi:MAG TPA: glycosyltransferase family 9 protein [Ktedonobacterales bacterium]|jgi:ADP-heptose:LPS heptosyltransferase|nr:glycosyltransferase family 9 protein [Ktedonobacterales bacterium]